MLTMGGGGAVILLGAYWLYEHPLNTLAHVVIGLPHGYGLMLRAFGAALFILVGGYLAFWLSYVRSGSGNFFIATEGEMKKVSWSSRREILGSTQVVVFTLIFMGVLLFVVDIFFSLLFSWMRILQIAPVRDLIGGGGT